MSTETYTLEVSETADGEALAADLYRTDRTLEDSIHIVYEEHALSSDREGEPPGERTGSVTTDATRVQLDYEHVGDTFEFRVLGDDGVLLTERVTNDEWQLQPAE